MGEDVSIHGMDANTFTLGLFSTLGAFERDSRIYMETMDEAIKIAGRPLPESLALTNFMEISSASLKKGAVLTGMLVSGLAKSTQKDAELRASVDLLRIAIAVERYRDAKGGVPDHLQDMIPDFLAAIPIDPFDGQPMRYRKLEKGYLVYSVGNDGKDNAGVRRDPSGKNHKSGATYDLTLKVER
jgi:hypothetical protein